jgi:hypothetical protein
MMEAVITCETCVTSTRLHGAVSQKSHLHSRCDNPKSHVLVPLNEICIRIVALGPQAEN